VSNRPVSVRFFFQKKKSVWLLFLIKTEPNWKWSPLLRGATYAALKAWALTREVHIPTVFWLKN
jgi:hypothetical protein